MELAFLMLQFALGMENIIRTLRGMIDHGVASAEVLKARFNGRLADFNKRAAARDVEVIQTLLQEMRILDLQLLVECGVGMLKKALATPGKFSPEEVAEYTRRFSELGDPADNKAALQEQVRQVAAWGIELLGGCDCASCADRDVCPNAQPCENAPSSEAVH